MLKRIFLVAASALLACFLAHAPARADGPVSICVQSIDPNTGSVRCAQVWTPTLGASNGLAALSTTVVAIKTTPGSLGTLYCYNPNASVAYVQLFDASSSGSITLGTTSPVQSFGIPPSLSSGVGPTAIGTGFVRGIFAAATTTPTGSTAPGTALSCSATVN